MSDSENAIRTALYDALGKVYRRLTRECMKADISHADRLKLLGEICRLDVEYANLIRSKESN